ncbi:hypothetical protein IEQ34_005114 [Dendrobium chrysotoxum]|uniref:Uncharacterized protein n=1 Tax=Dendrobium chrysotoxum TaxID=161865 RepID=A0AAV7H7Y4_DENCH|nr:hypothetical protein IEQ34_005114 [Dendrobium chrysotoxum]
MHASTIISSSPLHPIILASSFAFLLTPSPSSPTTTSLIHLATSSPLNPPSSSLSTFTATPSSTISSAFNGWSSCRGIAIIGTPCLIPSITELHPQWVTKPPTLGCAKILFCGAHPSITNPLSHVNPIGRRGSPPSNLTTHMEQSPHRSSPMASSTISLSDMKYSLPTETNATEPFSFLLSHSNTSPPSDPTVDMRGPTGITSFPMSNESYEFCGVVDALKEAIGIREAVGYFGDHCYGVRLLRNFKKGELIVGRAEEVVAEEGGSGGGDREKEDGGNVKARSGEGSPRLEKVVDKEVGGEGDEKAGEVRGGLVEGGFEEGHQMGREVFGGLEMWGKVVVVGGEVELGEVYVGEGIGVEIYGFEVNWCRAEVDGDVGAGG